MNSEAITEMIDNIGDILYEVEPELAELVDEEDVDKHIIKSLQKLEKDAQNLRDLVFKEFYKDEMLET